MNPLESTPPDAHLMQCMEVWGGNRAISSCVAMPGLTAWVYSQPYEGQDSGGDLHYVTSCATGRITRLVIADVAGHGVTVAKAADALRRLLCKYSNYADQTAFVESLNRRFAELADQADDDTVQPGAFATAVVATYFAPTDELAITNAGHPRPIAFRSSSRSWHVIHREDNARSHGDLPLGIDAPTTYSISRDTLHDDDLVLFYSDALIEARLPGGRLLGEAGLLGVLQEIEPREPETLIDRLLSAIKARGTGSDSFNDDVTALLVARGERPKPKPSIATSVKATSLIAAQALRSLRPGAMPAALPEFKLSLLGGALLDKYNKVSQDRP